MYYDSPTNNPLQIWYPGYRWLVKQMTASSFKMLLWGLGENLIPIRTEANKNARHGLIMYDSQSSRNILSVRDIFIKLKVNILI
jgi:hypothetical protein